MVRPAIYIRVSTAGQAAEGLSLEEQERRTRAYCAALDYPDPVPYIDAGESAYTDDPNARPAFARLLADCEAGLIDQIVVAKMSRWARSTTLTVQTLKRFEAIGVGLYSLDDKCDFSTPMGRMVTTILASINEYESDDKAETARRIHAYLKGQGKWDGGKPPFGARLDDAGRLEVDPATAPLLERFLRLAATEAPTTIGKIFTEEGIPPPGAGYRWRSRLPAWSPRHIARMIGKAGWLRSQGAPWPDLVDAAQRRPFTPRVKPDKPIRMLTGLMRCRSGGAVHYGGSGPYNRGGQTVRCRDFRQRPGGGNCPHGHTYAGVYEALVVVEVARVARRLRDLDPVEAARESPQAAEWAALAAERERVRHEYKVIGARYAHEFEREWRALEARETQLARRSAGPLGLVLRLLPLIEAFARREPAAQNALLRGMALHVEVWGREARVVWRPEIAATLGEPAASAD